MILGRPSRSSYLGILLGVFTLVLGAILYAWAYPSPHGFIEAFFAIPLMASGVVFMAMGLMVSWSRLGWLTKGIAVLLLVIGVMPLLLLLAVWVQGRL